MGISFEFVKECSRTLKKEFKGIEAFSYGYCCNTDYFSIWEDRPKNENDYVNAKIFKGGLNNNYHKGKWELGKSIYYNWKLTEFNLDNIIKVMQKVANKYGYNVETPKDKTKCIKVYIKEEL